MSNGITYVALGDSLTVGAGALSIRGFVKPYAKFTERALNTRVNVTNFAKKGMKSQYLTSLVMHNQHVRYALAQANVITITIGGNNLLHANRIVQSTQNFQTFQATIDQVCKDVKLVLSEIKKLKTSSPIPYIVRVIGIYNPYPHLTYSNYWVSQFNSNISSIASSEQFKYVDIASVLNQNQQLISLDKLHPNSQGYQLIAQQLVQSGYYPLV